MVMRNSEGHIRTWYGRIISPAMGEGGGGGGGGGEGAVEGGFKSPSF